MARKANLLFRMLLSLALIVAAMPLRANALPCLLPAMRKVACEMPCCEAKRVEMACCASVSPHASFGAPKAACKCEWKAVPAMPAPGQKAVVSAFFVLVAPSSAPLAAVSPTVFVGEPGVLGFDSSPPQSPPRRPDASRAPPVARA